MTVATWIGHEQKTGGAGSTQMIITPSNAGATAGDLMIVAMLDGGLSGGADGWTPIGTGFDNFGTWQRIHQGGAEPASHSFPAAGQHSGVLTVFRGAPDPPLDTFSRNESSGGTLTASSVTTTKDDCLLLWLGGANSSNTDLIVRPAEMTSRFAFRASTVHLAGATEEWSSTGATGNRVGTKAGTVGFNGTALIAIGPQAQEFHGTQGLAKLSRINVVIDGTEVPIDDDYSFRSNPLGYESANITIPAAYARRVEQGSLLTAYTQTGDVVWQGRVAQTPHVSRLTGQAQITATGHQQELTNTEDRYTLQVRGYDQWVEGGGEPHNYPTADSIDANIRKGSLFFKIPKGTDVDQNDIVPLLLWLEGTLIRRITFGIDTNNSLSDTQLRIQRATGPSGARNAIGADEDITATTVERNIIEANAQDQILVAMVRTGVSTTTGSVQRARIINLKVWGNRTQADTFSIQETVQDVAGDFGWDSSGVSSALSRNILPLDWVEGPWDGLLTYVLMLQDGWARVLEDRGSGAFLEANRWINSRVFEALDYDDEGTSPLALYNRWRVNFRNAAGRRRRRIASAIVPALDSRGLIREGRSELEDPQSDGDLALAVAEQQIEKYATPREQGVLAVFSARSPEGIREPYLILPGDKVRIPDHDLGQDFTHRVVGTMVTRDGVACEVGEPPDPEERMLTGAALKAARARQRFRLKRKRPPRKR